MLIKIDMNSGTAKCLWSDDVDLQSLGKCSVYRASNVEFCDITQAWYVFDPSMDDLVEGQPINGFKNRKEALAWEREWAEGRL